MTPLRKKMIRAMDLNNLAWQTQRSYLAAVNGLARHYGRSPDTISKKMIEDYLLYLKNKRNPRVNHDQCSGVYPQVLASQSAQKFCSHPPLWLFGQPQSL
jgi:hypothetical protein